MEKDKRYQFFLLNNLENHCNWIDFFSLRFKVLRIIVESSRDLRIFAFKSLFINNTYFWKIVFVIKYPRWFISVKKKERKIRLVKKKRNFQFNFIQSLNTIRLSLWIDRFRSPRINHSKFHLPKPNAKHKWVKQISKGEEGEDPGRSGIRSMEFSTKTRGT